jgi:hypothetical protein
MSNIVWNAENGWHDGPRVIICDGAYVPVLAVRHYSAGMDRPGPVKLDLPAREWVTERGSRWSGVKPDGSLYCDPLRGAR